MLEPAADPFFTPRQRHFLGFSIALFAVVATVALIAFLFVVFGRLVGFFSSVLWPLAVAGILALILRPTVDRLESKWRIRRLFAVIALYAVFLAFLAGVLVLMIPPLAQQMVDFFTTVPSLWQNALVFVKTHYPQWNARSEHLMGNPNVAAAVESVRGQLGRLPIIIIPSLRVVRDGAWGLVNFSTHLAIVPIYLFFFLLSRTDGTQRLPDHLSFLQPSLREDLIFLVREFIAIVVSFFRGQLVIGVIMGVLYALGFTVIGLRFGLFIGLLLGVLNIVPYLGTIAGLLIALPLALFQDDGGMHLMAMVPLVMIVVQTIEGWFLTPRIMGKSTGLHPVIIIIAVFFWGTALDGVLGMILAIPLTAFFVTVWRLLKRKYFPRT